MFKKDTLKLCWLHWLLGSFEFSPKKGNLKLSLMSNDENKFLPIFQILDIKNVSFMLKLEMALATTIRMKFEPVCYALEYFASCFNQSSFDVVFFQLFSNYVYFGKPSFEIETFFSTMYYLKQFVSIVIHT